MGNCNCDSNKLNPEQYDIITNQESSLLKQPIEMTGSFSNARKKNSKEGNGGERGEGVETGGEGEGGGKGIGGGLGGLGGGESSHKVNPLVIQTIGQISRALLPQIEFDGVGYYVGEWKDGKRDGKGYFKWNDGANYEGEWVKKKKKIDLELKITT